MPDWHIILRSVILWTLRWCIVLGAAIFFDAPEVICATPIMWLMAARIGLETAAGTRNTGWRLWLDLALAGALLAVILGILFGLIMPLSVSVTRWERDDLPGMVLFSMLVMIALGTPVCIALSMLFGWLWVRRMGK
ncbi:MAG: hypothetical protein RMK99_11150 [Anaerolineales bacterium]|nr:hypothetical protein [Anaerolineales bacterium]